MTLKKSSPSKSPVRLLDMTSHEQKQIVADLAEAKGLQGASVRLGRAGYGFFIKHGDRVLHDAIFDFDEAVCFLKNYDVGDSRLDDEH